MIGEKDKNFYSVRDGIKIVLEKQNYHIVMVCGARQDCKSIMLNLKEEERKHVTLDDINARRLAETDVGLFFATYGNCLLNKIEVLFQ